MVYSLVCTRTKFKLTQRHGIDRCPGVGRARRSNIGYNYIHSVKTYMQLNPVVVCGQTLWVWSSEILVSKSKPLNESSLCNILSRVPFKGGKRHSRNSKQHCMYVYSRVCWKYNFLNIHGSLQNSHCTIKSKKIQTQSRYVRLTLNGSYGAAILAKWQKCADHIKNSLDRLMCSHDAGLSSTEISISLRPRSVGSVSNSPRGL